MLRHASIGSAVLTFGSLVVFGIVDPGQTDGLQSRFQTSCFAVMGKVACIDGGFMPVAPGAPFVLTGIDQEGEWQDEDMTIRDDGGREIARG